MDVVSTLKNARSLLAKRKGWCRESFARNQYGASCLAESSEACSFCMHGALRAADKNGNTVYYAYQILTDILRSMGFRSGIYKYNDMSTTRKKDVISVFDKAIRKAKREIKKQA
jgi:hypothetical protein